MIKSWIKSRAQKNLVRFVKSRYDVIKPIPKQGLFNRQCHNNSVEYSQIHDCGIVETIYIDNGEPILHYLNTDNNGIFLETTLGWKAGTLEYYKIREIHSDDYFNISHEFIQSLESWTVQFLGWFGRKVLMIDRIV